MKKNLIFSGLLFLMVSLVVVLVSCKQNADKKEDSSKVAVTIPEVRDLVMYELFIRNFTKEGTFNAIIPRLDEIKDLGVNVIWLMPIQPTGQLNKKGTYGSPYSISDYYAVNPDYGTKKDFRNLVDAIHAKGLYVIIDEVANHTSQDNGWISEHPDWYTRDSTGKIVPPVADWTDVADLNFDNAELRKEMTNSLKYWIDSFNIDGYRCDVAGMVPFDWWKETITELRKSRPIFMLAEGDDPKLYESGFDMTYGWSMYQVMKKVLAGNKPVISIDTVLQKEEKDFPSDYNPIRFTDNHDENSWDNVPAVKFQSEQGAKAAYVIMTTLPGVPFLYQGQEAGYETKINLFEKYDIDWKADPEMRNFYKSVLALHNKSNVLKNGAINWMNSGSDDVVIYSRTLSTDTMVVMVNVRNKDSRFTIPKIMTGRAFTNALTDQSESLQDEIVLKPFEYKILKAAPAR
jgi:glycosidase